MLSLYIYRIFTRWPKDTKSLKEEVTRKVIKYILAYGLFCCLTFSDHYNTKSTTVDYRLCSANSVLLDKSRVVVEGMSCQHTSFVVVVSGYSYVFILMGVFQDLRYYYDTRKKFKVYVSIIKIPFGSFNSHSFTSACHKLRNFYFINDEYLYVNEGKIRTI